MLLVISDTTGIAALVLFQSETRRAETSMDPISAGLIAVGIILAFIMMCASGYQMKYAIGDLLGWARSDPSEYDYEDLMVVPISVSTLVELAD